MDDEVPHDRSNIVAWSLRFEAGLGLVAVIWGVLAGYPPTASMTSAKPGESLWALFWGVLAAFPLFGALILADRYPLGPLRSLQETLNDKVLQLFHDASLGDLAMISFAAGLGEELLFRGVLQELLVHWSGAWWGLVGAALVFGACHWISNTYAVLAALIGVYLGGLFLLTQNLLAPIATHALYDFLALAYLLKWRDIESPRA